MEGVTPILLQQGIAGVAILAEAFVILRLYNDGKTLQNKYDNLQEARRLDAKETTAKVTQPLEGISQTLGLIYDKLEDSKRGR